MATTGSPQPIKDICHVCAKKVYPQERTAADERVYHKTCFRCKKCAGVLKLGSFASMEGEVFCKPCFKKMFFTKGNYSDGFGKLKPQEQHDLKTGRTTVAISTTSFKGVGTVLKTSSSPQSKSPSSSPSLSRKSENDSDAQERVVDEIQGDINEDSMEIEDEVIEEKNEIVNSTETTEDQKKKTRKKGNRRRKNERK